LKEKTKYEVVGLSLLTEKEILNNAIKLAIDMEQKRQSKYAFLARNARDKKLKELFGSFAVASRRRIALLKTEMKNLNIR
jgi:rubrerythrin